MIRFDCRGCGAWDDYIAECAAKHELAVFRDHQIVTVHVSTLDQLRLLLHEMYRENCGHWYIPTNFKSVTMEILG